MTKAKSSGHFAVGGSGYFYHNDRSHKTKNSIFSDEKNDVSCSANEAMKMYRQELQKRSEAYTARTNQKLQKNIATHRSLIINLHKHHTLNDLEEVKNYLEKSLDTKVLQIAIHRDEGYIDKETGEEHKNYHAHIELMGIDSHGISIAQHQNKNKSKKQVEATREKRLDKKFYSEFQTFLANTLGMERGKRNSKAKRLDTYEFKREAEKIAKEKRATISQVKAQLKAEKQALIDSQKATKEDHANLRKRYKELEALARKKELTISDLKTELAEKSKKKPLLEKIGFTSNAKDEEIEKLTKINRKLKSRLKQANSKIEAIEKQKPDIIEYIKDLQAQIESLEKQKQKEKIVEKIVEMPKIEYVENPVNIELKRKIRELEQELNKHKKENEISTQHSYQHLLFFKHYKALVTTDLSDYYVKSQDQKTIFSSKKKNVEVHDAGDRLVAKSTNIQEQVKLMLDIAKAKKWDITTLIINGSDEFKNEAHKQIAERLEIAEDFKIFDELYSEPEEPKEPEPQPEAKLEPKEPKEPEKPKEKKVYKKPPLKKGEIDIALENTKNMPIILSEMSKQFEHINNDNSTLLDHQEIIKNSTQDPLVEKTKEDIEEDKAWEEVVRKNLGNKNPSMF